MKKMSTLVIEGIVSVVFSIIGGIIALIGGAYIGASLEATYTEHYMEVPAWAVIVPVMMCAFGICYSIFMIIQTIIYISGWCGQKIEDYGKIVEILSRKKGYTEVIVELSNGHRLNLQADKKMILAQGDNGLIGVQGKHLVYLTKVLDEDWICKKCSAKNTSSANFCKKCGEHK